MNRMVTAKEWLLPKNYWRSRRKHGIKDLMKTMSNCWAENTVFMDPYISQCFRTYDCLLRHRILRRKMVGDTWSRRYFRDLWDRTWYNGRKAWWLFELRDSDFAAVEATISESIIPSTFMDDDADATPTRSSPNTPCPRMTSRGRTILIPNSVWSQPKSIRMIMRVGRIRGDSSTTLSTKYLDQLQRTLSIRMIICVGRIRRNFDDYLCWTNQRRLISTLRI
jgi:hypothetical protein